MSSMPILLPTTPFNIENCVTCSDLVNISYNMYADWISAKKPSEKKFSWTPPTIDFEFSQPIWGETKALWVFTHDEPFALIATNKTQAFVIFRGTESVEDWLVDGDADQEKYSLVEGYGKVHHGFLKLYKSIRKSLLKTLQETMKNSEIKELFITGHSLGSGLSTVAVPDIVHQTFISENTELSIKHINLASPRVGDPDFTSALNQCRASNYRVVNTCDLVPTVPPSILGSALYQHVGTAVTFTAQYGSYAKNHSSVNSYHYALENIEQPSSTGK